MSARSVGFEIQGVHVPPLFYGTAWKEDRTAALVRQALDAGFTAIDTANQRKHYFEAGVGEAIAAFLARGRQRTELFLQTKFTYARGQDHRLPYDPNAPFEMQVRDSFASSLEHLGVDRIDSYVLHGPWSGTGLHAPDHEAWRAMEGLVASGSARLIGVSNISLEQLRELYAFAAVKPAFVQNRCYARQGWDAGVRAFCREHGIGYQGFSLLTANRSQVDGKVVARIAKKHGRTNAQVVFAFARRVGMITLTGTSSERHLVEDLQSTELELDDEDLLAIENVG